MAAPPPLRLCVAVEASSKHRPLWAQTTARVLEPLLAMLEAQAAVELALVLFGAHAPSSAAAVESTPWTAGVPPFRRVLEGLAQTALVGGAGQPVALAEALAEAAALFALPLRGGGAFSGAQHLLVCIASDPACHPVPWPYAEDCCLVRGGGGGGRRGRARRTVAARGTGHQQAMRLHPAHPPSPAPPAGPH